MDRDDGELWQLAAYFATLSFLAVGGVNVVVPELHRYVVGTQGWMSSQRFTDLFAIAQAAPGPNFTVVTLIGWHVAAVPGALVSTLAMVLPTGVVTYLVAHAWRRFREARWRIAVQNGLAPVTIGLVFASAYILARTADTSWTAVAVTIVTAAALFRTRLHPLLFLGGGALVGMAGLI